MEWGKDYRLGLIWQDFQHKELIDRMVELEKAIREGADKNDFYGMIGFLGNYINDHFALEEVYMKKYNYPHALEHIKQHRKFSEEFRKFKSGCIYQEKKTSIELFDKLSLWVSTHLQVIDKTLAEFLIKKGLESPKIV
ncbi:MAG: hemerythrin family protein [Proteobacteria bacterium]|nr:hemerythrin family protein [Pseudomonadota bacterium]MBU1739611.1 hemerythrin family protein [Pseudomonadota bacterium]